MAKRKKSVTGSQKRLKDRNRKREARGKSKSLDGTSDDQDVGSSVPCGTVDGAVTAPPSNFLGKVSMGFPLKEEKPLARVQASPRVKMHPPAPRLASPRGSRLFVQKGKAPSPDSPPWVCAPPRAPGPDTGHVSGPAGQAQLEGSRMECTSRILKDVGFLKENLKELERNTNIYEKENNNISGNSDCNEADPRMKKRNADVYWQKAPKKGNVNVFHSVQGSFHQADILFEENAGTQCVANCLAALSYHRLRNTIYWTASDMNRILMTGDELYTLLQRSSLIRDRYLLVEELPELFECFNRSYEFHANDELASVILPNDRLNYAEFNALPLDEALQVALADTDGCFVCFGGNTMLIAKADDHFFTFDPHARTVQGMQSSAGKCTRVLYENLNQLFEHIQSLALSMGYTQDVECNLTGVHCEMNCIANPTDSAIDLENEFECTTSVETTDELGDDDITFICHEHTQYSFLPLSAKLKMHVCEKLNVPYMENSGLLQCTQQELSKPATEKEIVGDGNCFFRAISFSLTNSEEYYNVMRNTVCTHLKENKELFKAILRDNEESVENHLCSFKMSIEGSWATEVEIFAMAHLLNIDIYTYTNGHWLKFSCEDIDPYSQSIQAAIYLNHCGQNHYNVVLTVTDENVNAHKNLKESEGEMPPTTRNTLDHNDLRNQNKRKSSRRQGNLIAAEKRRQSIKFRYMNDVEFREKKLKEAFVRYNEDEEIRKKKLEDAFIKYNEDDAFRVNARLTNKERYKADNLHRLKTRMRTRNSYTQDIETRQKMKEASIDKYATDLEHRENIKFRSIHKYAKDEHHRESVKKRSIQRYAVNEQHREEMKTRSIQKYADNEEHREHVKTRSIQKYGLDEKHREDVKRRSKRKYETDEAHKKLVNDSSIKRYRQNEEFRKTKISHASERYKADQIFRSKLKAYSKNQYRSSALVRETKKDKVRITRNAKQAILDNENELVKLFKEKAKEGIDYSCCCCDRLLFQNQVQKCDRESYLKNMNATTVAEMCIQEKYCHQCSESCPVNCTKYRSWICYTCHRKIMSGKIPAEAAANNMALEDIPKQLADLNGLEKHLIALHIPFMKVMALPHGGQRNIHGPVVCVPSDLKKVTHLPMKQGEDLLLRVKLKRKLNYKGYFEYQFVNPKHIQEALHFLKRNNQWYENVIINENWNEINDHEILEENEGLQEDKELETVATDTCLQPVDIAQEVLDHYFDDIYDIAPGEGNNPVRMLQEHGNEAKSFPHLFPSGRFSWNEERETRITLSRYFNNRLMNSDDRFAKDSNYIFFSQFVSDLNQVIEKTQISIRKCIGTLKDNSSVTSSMIQNPEVLSRLMKNDEALRFMQPIRGTPAYWSSAQKDLFAMLRQLGIPTWFCSFSAAEHRWNDAVATILRQQNDNRDPSSLDWSEKNEVLRTNPVTVARMFEHRFHVFQTEVIFSNSSPIGKVTDFFQRVEFQQRGSPHMHCLYWIENAPRLDQDGEEAVCEFIDKYVSCAVPSENEDRDFRDTVLAVQQHSKSHSKSCRKRGSECRFNFPRPPSVNTFISSPQEQEVTDNDTETSNLKQEQLIAKQILIKVWNGVQDLDDSKTTEEMFSDIDLTQAEYEEAHKILAKKRSIILRRNPDELWINQYNPCLLKCWDANMDIQFVLDPFSCIVYIVSYISKSEREMGMLLKQTKIEAEEGNASARSTLKKIGSAYLNHREVGAQEAVYRVCNLKMKECSRKVVFIPVGENTTRLTKPLSQLKKQVSNEYIQSGEHNDDNDSEDESDIWMTNIVERYENRPNESLFQNMCLAEFCSEFRVLAKSQIPKTQNANVFELQNSKGYIQRRTRTKPAIIRYPRFDVQKMPEKFHQCHLQLFLPYWTKAQLKPPRFDLYQTFYENGHVRIQGSRQVQPVKEIVDANHASFAQNEEAIVEAQEAFENIGEPEDAWASLCPESELRRRECTVPKLNSNENEELPDMQNETNTDVLYKVQQNTGSRDEMLPFLQNLNETQMRIFYLLREWCLKKVFRENPEPLHIFITGGAGTGKSHLIKAIHYEASRILSKILSVPDSVSVLLAAFTGTAAFNIGGNTLHHLFSLPKFMPLPYEPLREQSLSEMRVQLADLQILIIDEISMVYKRLLYYVHERLVQIKKCKKPFGGVTVIAVGDFYQLPPVKQRKDERLYKLNVQYPVDYWNDFFKVVELTDIMRQREDIAFAAALNSLRIRVGDQPMEQETKDMLNACVREGPIDALHVYATNEEVNEYNLTMLRGTCDDLVEIDALDFTKDTSTGNLKLRNKPMTRSSTDSLCSSLLLGLNARVMLTRNCNVDDGLVNGVMGHVSRFVFGVGSAADTVLAVEVIFDNANVGTKTGRRTTNGNTVLIERVHEDIKGNKLKPIVRHQFPLKLSWACTAHKVQGMTVDKVVVNLDRCFSAGQGYVALSRVTSQRGLFIETCNLQNLNNKIHADAEVKISLQQMPILPLPEVCTNSNEEINIFLHNIQSLNKHFKDLQKDIRCKNVDVICLTETWLRSGQNVTVFEIDGFHFQHVSREDVYNNDSEVSRLQGSKGGGVAVYFKDICDGKKVLSLPEKNVEGICVLFVAADIALVSIYRPKWLNASVFLMHLQKLIDHFKSCHKNVVVVGDFNEDAMTTGPIQTFMSNHGFKQVVNFYTTEGATILDHVYVAKSLQAQVQKASTYYSYHDAVLLNIKTNTT